MVCTLVESGSESESEEDSEESNKSSSQSEKSSSDSSDSDKKKKTQRNKKLQQQKSASKDRYLFLYQPCDKNEPIAALIRHLLASYSLVQPVMLIQQQNFHVIVRPSDFTFNHTV